MSACSSHIYTPRCPKCYLFSLKFLLLPLQCLLPQSLAAWDQCLGLDSFKLTIGVPHRGEKHQYKPYYTQTKENLIHKYLPWAIQL